MNPSAVADSLSSAQPASRGHSMVIGVDFDNTIVRYDELFHRVAVERGLVPAGLPARKNEVRDFLRRQGRERDWTELQGHVYGPRMIEAQPFTGVKEFFRRVLRQGIPLFVISHKTRHPVIGPPHDLHQAARDWLAAQGFFDADRVGLPPENVRFGVTREEKIRWIREAGCTHFIDDLEETFLEASFPQEVVRILFNQEEVPPGLAGVRAAADWGQVTAYVFPAS